MKGGRGEGSVKEGQGRGFTSVQGNQNNPTSPDSPTPCAGHLTCARHSEGTRNPMTPKPSSLNPVQAVRLRKAPEMNVGALLGGLEGLQSLLQRSGFEDIAEGIGCVGGKGGGEEGGQQGGPAVTAVEERL